MQTFFDALKSEVGSCHDTSNGDTLPPWRATTRLTHTTFL